ncbi:DEAD/DEAH box helicase [Actinomyces sp. 2119]|uniref:RNA helicase n=1 Tax=Actinomyces lilanjuaniae TaxID=2321394 RepID=A0ABM6Z6J0_9ACTO|nr:MULTISPECIES: DEAD/DEAH box helicase [Actinomyces]AYD90793.1 DEAD/DEAH box helicase [Actinomyces lilanjuaniae]RJF43314.1 DEAD/DEAH box helicase [Actinomyces sp. 2119]
MTAGTAGTTGQTGVTGIIETIGAHAPVLEESVPDVTDGEDTQAGTEAAARRTFADLGVEPEICDALTDKGITHPFPIQALTLPIALKGQDIIGQAKTGTGKTLGFGIPLLMDTLGPGEEGWDEDPASGSPQALVVLPTRELAKQVAEELATAAARRTVRIIQVYGGRAYEPQIEAVEKGAEVVVGTPGRLIDLMDRGVLDLAHVTTVVLDEADEMLDLGFLPDVEKILSRTRADRHTMLFSATMPGAVVALARRYMTRPTHVRAQDPGDDGMTVQTVQQVVYRTHALNKVEVMARILQARDRGRTIVFARTKRTAARVAEDLASRGFATAALHGDLGQGAREQALRAFRKGKVDVLVATDVAARGIDVDDVTHVVNYQCPEDEKIYVHRIGRTGRAGGSGTAVTFVDWDDVPRWRLIAKALGLPVQEPVETYHTSDHLYTDLSVPREVTGSLPRDQRTLAGLGAEEIEDLGETGRRAREDRGDSRQRDRGRRGSRGHSDSRAGQDGRARRGRARRNGQESSAHAAGRGGLGGRPAGDPGQPPQAEAGSGSPAGSGGSTGTERAQAGQAAGTPRRRRTRRRTRGGRPVPGR